MIRTVALLALVASSSPGLFGSSEPISEPWNPGFSQIFPANLSNPYFVGLPRTSDEAIDKGWVKIEGPPQPEGYEDLTAYMKLSEPTTAILIDETYGNVAGLIILILVGDVTSYYTDMVEQGFFLFSLTIDGITNKYYTSTIFFVSDDRATRTYDENQVVQTNYVAFQSLNGQLEYIPNNLMDIKNNASSVWIQQNCVKLMGSHYYYEMTETTTCDKPFIRYFPLYDEKTKQLTGFGFMLLGKCTGKTFECPSTAAVKMIVNHGPQCLYDLVDKHGACTRHVYFVDNPALITC